MYKKLFFLFFSQLYKVDDLPLLVNGKVDRQSLMGMYEKRLKGKFYLLTSKI